MTALRLSALAGLLMLAGLLVLAMLFVPRRPSPTGPHPIGRMDVMLHEPNGRALPVAVWYPQGLAAPAPVVLYSPGWGGTRTNSSIQVENLASHGFVVVGCDDIASDPNTDPDRGVSIELQSDAALKATLERADRHVVLQANRVLEVLRALEDGQARDLAGRLDLSRVGVMGYSVGGAAAIQAGLADHRIRAVLNVDGALSGPPADQIGPQAYFLLSSQEAFPTDAEQNSPDPAIRNYAYISAIDIPRNKKRMERPRNYWVVVDSAAHDDMADGLFERRRNPLFRSNAQRAAINAAVGRLEVAYFRSTLMDDNDALRGLIGNAGQSVRWVSPTSATPGTANAKP